MGFCISADSGCDLPLSVCEANNIKPLFMSCTINGETYTDTMVDEDIRKFYDMERKGAVPKTSQISPLQFVDFWNELLKENNEILHISMSSGISGTYKNAVTAAEMIRETNPDCKIHVVDSLMTCTGMGALVLKAVEMRNEGKTADECENWLNEHKLELITYFTTNNLNYLYKGGRVSKTGAVFGTVLKINPLLCLDRAGSLKVFEKVRGEKASLDRMLELMEKTVIDPENHTLYVSHADNIEKAKTFGEAMQKKFNFKDVKYYYIGTTIGSHTGQGLIATFFFGKPRQDIKKEI